MNTDIYTPNAEALAFQRNERVNITLEGYFQEGQPEGIYLTTGEREDFEDDNGLDFTSDTLDAETFAKLRSYALELGAVCAS